MKHILLTLSLLITLQGFSQMETTPLVIGESITFHSNILNEERTINIYLPQVDYLDSSATQFPVIYLLDGSMNEDFVHVSGLVQFLSNSWINVLPPSIVVGIANVDRKRDFTYPSTVKEDQENVPTSGGSEDFIAFLEQEVKPLVENAYPTLPHTTLIGQSLGGLVATEILLKHSDLFDDYIIVSPSLWWDNESMLDAELPDLSSKHVCISVGKEGEIMERIARELHEKLKTASNSPAFLYFDFFENHDHGDVLHEALYKAFEALSH